MAAFELGNLDTEEKCDLQKTVKQECIIALKVYDSCKMQECLGENEIGPARCAERVCIGDEQCDEGEIMKPPCNAASVSIDRLRTKKVTIVNKEPSPFRNGYWDVDLKFLFEYRLTFREIDGGIIGSVRANSVYNKKVMLFGSVSSDLVISTDLFRTRNESSTIDAEPFVLDEAKCVALSAELKHCRFRDESDGFSQGPREVIVNLGLFTIVKLFRIVDLLIDSRGYSIPGNCSGHSPTRPCDYFESLEFPMDIFAPPSGNDQV